MQKNVQTTETTAYFHMLACEISHASKVILKILQANSRWTENFQMCKLCFEQVEETEIKLTTSVRS